MLTVNRLRLRDASGETEFSYGGAVAKLTSRAEAEALAALFGYADAGPCRAAADISAGGTTASVSVSRAGKRDGRSAALTDGTPFPELFALTRMSAEERFLSVYRPGGSYSARLAGYADPARYFPKKDFSALTDGAGETAVFRRMLRERLRGFCPDDGPERELLCFIELNALWRDVEAVRDMHRVFPPLLLCDPPPGARFGEAAEALDRQIFILSPF